MERYRAHNWHCLGGLPRERYAAIYTTLGCPYRCSFCCIQAPFRDGERAAGMRENVNSYRLWSPERVVEEIGLLVERYGVRNLKIADEMFVLNPRHVSRICDFLIERRYDLNIWAYSRIDTVKPGMLEKLRAAGFRWLAFGIEAGDERVREGVDKGFAQERVYRVIEEVRSAGIHVIGNYIFGLPDDDHDTMRATLDLALDLNCEFANFYCAMAYPGSPLHEEATRLSVPLPANWTGYSQHSADCLPLPTRHLTSAEVLRFRDEAFQTYYGHPRYLRTIESRFGNETVEEVRRMARQRLDRDLLTGRMPATDSTWPREQTMPLETIGR
jgi:anaerobic magnesium-protoporphyrin IX monomethyl ester cyclase